MEFVLGKRWVREGVTVSFLSYGEGGPCEGDVPRLPTLHQRLGGGSALKVALQHHRLTHTLIHASLLPVSRLSLSLSLFSLFLPRTQP